MSAYRRFVAYVYEYQKEQKKENRGFVKVEAKGGECVMDIRLQCPNLAPEQGCRIYGFLRKKQDLMGILLGECRTRPGGIEHRIRTRAEELNGQPVRLEELGGMAILLDGAFYGTQWDDEPISPLAFRLPKEAEKKEDEESGEKLEDGGRGGKEASNMPEAAEENRKPEGMPAAEEKKKEPEGTPEMEKDNKEQKSKPEQEEGGKEPESKPEQEEEGKEPESKPEQAQESKGPDHKPERVNMPEVKGSESQKAPEETRVPVLKVPIQNQAPEPEAWEEEPEERAVHTAEALFDQAHRVPERKQWEEFWPFDDGEITGCVKVTHRDFQKLNKRDWGLKNNRFLLYGYQHFGYLLLGKLRGTDQYVLGVPGVYDQQERFMANMFGFPHFKISRTLQLEAGRGGYWYRMIGAPAAELQSRTPQQ